MNHCRHADGSNEGHCRFARSGCNLAFVALAALLLGACSHRIRVFPAGESPAAVVCYRVHIHGDAARTVRLRAGFGKVRGWIPVLGRDEIFRHTVDRFGRGRGVFGNDELALLAVDTRPSDVFRMELDAIGSYTPKTMANATVPAGCRIAFDIDRGVYYIGDLYFNVIEEGDVRAEGIAPPGSGAIERGGVPIGPVGFPAHIPFLLAERAVVDQEGAVLALLKERYPELIGPAMPFHNLTGRWSRFWVRSGLFGPREGRPSPEPVLTAVPPWAR